MENVTLCTTMWETVPLEKAEAREAELMVKFWAPMLKSKATIARHDHTTASARQVLQRFTSLQHVDLQLQLELAGGKTLSQTQTGQELNQKLLEFQEAAREELRRMKEDMQKAAAEKDEIMQQTIAEERRELQQMLRQARLDVEVLDRNRTVDEARWLQILEAEHKKWKEVLDNRDESHKSILAGMQDGWKNTIAELSNRGGCVVM